MEDKHLYDTITQDISKYDNIELINDGNATAPSKRLDAYTNGNYCKRKTTASINILQKIDLTVLAKKCRHFHKWLQTIETLAHSP